jgi:hypothetical protein
MGVFTRSIVVEYNPQNALPYRIFREFEFHLAKKNSGTFVRCEKGFEFDGLSMPWGMQWIISPGDMELLQCAAGHDKVFSTGTLTIIVNSVEMKHRVRRVTANKLMAQMMKARRPRVKWWKRLIVNTGLMLGSGTRWRELRDFDANKREI